MQYTTGSLDDILMPSRGARPRANAPRNKPDEQQLRGAPVRLHRVVRSEYQRAQSSRVQIIARGRRSQTIEEAGLRAAIAGSAVTPGYSGDRFRQPLQVLATPAKGEGGQASADAVASARRA